MGMERAGIELDSVPDSVAFARGIIREYAGDMHVGLLADAELLTSEVVTNAVLHGRPPIRLEISRDSSALWVSVHDQGADLPVTPDVKPHRTATSGRGLRIVDALSSSWGVTTEFGQPGKAVWFRIDDPHDDSGPTERA